MPRILVFQHVAAEPLGTLDRLIRQRGHRVRFHNFHRQPDINPRLDRYRGLVVLGGPQNVDEAEHKRHLHTEMRAIEAMLKADKPVLGICLGAQLLAHVLGAPVRRHRFPEVGWHPLKLTDAGHEDTVLQHWQCGAPVFQWHHYSFEVPQSAVHLAHTDTCEAQAFRYDENAYGFQFHMEMDLPLIRRWLSNRPYLEALAQSGHRLCPETVHAQSERLLPPMQTCADAVFNAFLDLIGRPDRRYTLPSREWV